MDIRKDHDEKTNVKDGVLYRKGHVIQVWWDRDVLGRQVVGIKGRETWINPDMENTLENYNCMKSRWK